MVLQTLRRDRLGSADPQHGAGIIARMERDSIEELISYDTDFDRVPGISRLEP